MVSDQPFFTVCQHRRRRLVNGDPPAGLASDRPPPGRTWRACENRMHEVPAWERAERYRQLMEQTGFMSVRALARSVGEDHSRIARVLKILDLPESVLAILRDHSDDVRIRAHFTESRLRHLVTRRRSEAAILRQIEEVLQPPSDLLLIS